MKFSELEATLEEFVNTHPDFSYEFDDGPDKIYITMWYLGEKADLTYISEEIMRSGEAERILQNYLERIVKEYTWG